FFNTETQLATGCRAFSKEYKQLEQKYEQTITDEVDDLMNSSTDLFTQIGNLVEEVRRNMDMIDAPTLVVQAELDQIINTDSACYIYEHIQAENKELKWYEKSGHVITLDKEKDILHEDSYTFLERLPWNV